MLHPNTSTPEAAWTAITGLAALINAAMLWLVAGDLLDLYRARRNGAKRIAAWTAVGIKGTLTLVQCIFVGIGLYAATQPPVNPNRPISPVSLVLSIGLIVAAILLAALGVFMHVRRLQLLDYLAGEVAAAEMLVELRHNTAVTEAAKDEAKAGKHEAAAAHAKGQEVLDKIDEQTRRAPGNKGERHERND